VSELLCRYGTFESSLEIVRQQLEKARHSLRLLPESNGRANLFALCDYLARQTLALLE
jgi:geranylgeranyl pyrophosphate synthase